MASFLGRIEHLLERAVEGTSGRVFRARLQPIQLAKAAVRAMQAQQLIGPDGPEVPNRYVVLMHPSDFALFVDFRRSLQSQIERYLARAAADRGLRPVAAWRVELAADPSVRPREVRVDARMADDEASHRDDPSNHQAPPDGTLPLPRAIGVSASPEAMLAAEDGRLVPLDAPITSLGRALDNDVVIADSRVSRYHAEIRGSPRGWVVRDLGSTNGTALNGTRVTEARLAPPDELSLGGFTINVRAVPRPQTTA